MSIFSLSSCCYYSNKSYCRDACYATQPKELLNPETMLTSESNHSSSYKNSGTSTPSSKSDRTSTEELALRNNGEAIVGLGESVQSSGGNQPAGRGFMGGVMDSILNFKRKSVTSDSLPANLYEVCDS